MEIEEVIEILSGEFPGHKFTYKLAKAKRDEDITMMFCTANRRYSIAIDGRKSSMIYDETEADKMQKKHEEKMNSQEDVLVFQVDKDGNSIDAYDQIIIYFIEYINIYLEELEKYHGEDFDQFLNDTLAKVFTIDKKDIQIVEE